MNNDRVKRHIFKRPLDETVRQLLADKNALADEIDGLHLRISLWELAWEKDPDDAGAQSRLFAREQDVRAEIERINLALDGYSIKPPIKPGMEDHPSLKLLRPEREIAELRARTQLLGDVERLTDGPRDEAAEPGFTVASAVELTPVSIAPEAAVGSGVKSTNIAVEPPTPNPREAKIIELWNGGNNASQIAHKLGVASKTIANHIGVLRNRYGDGVVSRRRRQSR